MKIITLLGLPGTLSAHSSMTSEDKLLVILFRTGACVNIPMEYDFVRKKLKR